MFMIRFCVGEQVLIRYGRHQGQKAKIIESQAAHVYKVKIEDGPILFYSGKGLEMAKEGVQKKRFVTAVGQPRTTTLLLRRPPEPDSCGERRARGQRPGDEGGPPSPEETNRLRRVPHG